MKDLGFTNEGKRIVEMSSQEYDEFAKLSLAIEGQGFPSFLEARRSSFVTGFDLTTTFGVIHAYYTQRFQINEFQRILDAMKEAIEQKG